MCKNQLLVTSIGPIWTWTSERIPFAILIVFRFELGMMHNQSLQPTANRLRDSSAAELGRWTMMKVRGGQHASYQQIPRHCHRHVLVWLE